MNKAFLIALITVSFSMLSMDTPKFVKQNIYDGVSISMPEDFVVMSDRDIAAKYPSTKKPLAIFMSSDTKADFTLNNSKAKLAGQTAEMLHELYKVTILETFDTTAYKKDKLEIKLKFLNDGVKTVNKRKYAYFEFVTEYNNKVDGNSIKKYYYIMYTAIKKDIIILNFSCDQKKIDVYQPVANKMMSSVKISSKIKVPDYFLQQNNNVPRKRQSSKDLLEMQNKNKSKINNGRR